MTIDIDRHEAKDMQKVLDRTYQIVFGGERPEGDQFSKYALIARDEEGAMLGYCTIRPVDDKTVFVPFGGIMPGLRGEKSFEVAAAIRDFLLNGQYNKITGVIDSENVMALSLGFKLGFRIVGMRAHESRLLIEVATVKK